MQMYFLNTTTFEIIMSIEFLKPAILFLKIKINLPQIFFD
jgi:hypothetical protein